MNDFEAERERRRIEASFEAMGNEFDMEGRCTASETETGATFSELDGNGRIAAQHIFTFAPTIGDEA